jgi:hypothetical protein
MRLRSYLEVWKSQQKQEDQTRLNTSGKLTFTPRAIFGRTAPRTATILVTGDVDQERAGVLKVSSLTNE